MKKSRLPINFTIICLALLIFIGSKFSTNAVSAKVENFFNSGDVCEHIYDTYVFEPTCLIDGSTYYSCRFCGDSYVIYTDALGHDMSVLLESKNPTCKESGYEKRQCSRCDTVETIALPTAGHVESEWITLVAPTCLGGGIWATYCTVCGEELKRGEIASAGHSFDVTSQLNSCAEDGVDIYSCTACGYSYSVVTAEKLGHNITEWSVETPAECEKSGISVGKCDRCGHVERREITALEHVPTNWIIVKAADCTSIGYKRIACSVCDKTLESDTIPAKGHDIVTDKAVAVTCTTDGKTEGTHCKTCKAILQEQTVIKAKGHKTKQTKTAATVGKDGKIATVCTICNKTIKSTTIAKISTVKLAATSYAYDNKMKTPEVTVKDSKGKVLQRSTDYTVKYESGRKLVGAYSVTVTFKGNYSGTKTLTFKILPDKVSTLSATQTTTTVKLTWNKVKGATGYVVYQYDTQTKKYVKLRSTTKTTYTVSELKPGTTYKFAVKAYTKSDKTTYYSGSYKEISTATMPSAPTLKVTSGKSKAALSWNKVSGASGYVIYMSTSKDGTYKPIATIKNVSTLKYTKSGLSQNKTYYFKIRAYKTVGKANIYSGYSSVKSVKIK